MTQEEVTAQIAVLKDVAKTYSGRTIENIITNLETIKKYLEEHNNE